jgi:hypothetical protein|tara:strand:+ start:2246 stop:2680 length:435 start_codon:yes stop_codon:yes gene_type:complete
MGRFAQGRFEAKNPGKYVGRRTPIYRSSWEFAFMKFCDENPSIQAWASEAVKIPFRNPLTGKMTIYVPDFFIQYKTKKGKNMVELIEVKPDNQVTMESAGKSKHNKLAVALNMAKWEAARAYCKSKGLSFRVVTEKDMFHNGKR